MTVGYLRVFRKNMSLKQRTMFALANMHDIEFFSFAPKDIDVGKKTINGLFWDRDQKDYVRRETPYPTILDNEFSFRRGHSELYKELSKHCYMIYKPMGRKERIYEMIKTTPFSKYAIETYKYKDIHVGDVLKKYETLILKPDNGRKGIGVYKLAKSGDNYCLKFGIDKELILSPLEFEKQYSEQFSLNYVVQPFISSVTDVGNPFDIRLHLRRGKNGKWITCLIYPRIGSAKTVVSNISTGGSVSLDVKVFLKQEIGSNWRKIYRELVYISNEFPDIIQAKYKRILDSLAIDVGIDRSRGDELKFFEVSGYPGVAAAPFQSSEATVQFYKYLMELKSKGEI